MPTTLSPSQIDHFIQHGWLKIEQGAKQEVIDDLLKTVWIRLGWDPENKDTWVESEVKMPGHREVEMRELLTDEAWGAICE